MAITIQKTFGGKPKQVSALGRDLWKASSSRGVHITLYEALAPSRCAVDHALGNSVGAI